MKSLMAMLFMATASWAVAEDFAGMRGANYVPSYARNDVQIWMDYDPGIIDRELGYAERLKLNTVRVFLQVAVYERDPKLFLQRFDDFLGLCEKHRLRMMPVVFDSCFGEFPDLVNYKTKDWMANPGQNRLGREHWAKLEQYVRDAVGGHKDDRRIVIWDVMNEPTCTSFNKPQDKELIWTFLRHFLDYVKQVDPSHSRTVGVENSSLIPQVLDRVEVLATHNYRKDLREDLRAVKALGCQHGKPVIINEVAGRPQQPYSCAMPILAEEKVGWCFWELMIGRTQFTQGATPYQGVIYPDGTCFDAAEVMQILYPGQTSMEPKQVAAEVGLPQRTGPWSVERAWAWYKAHGRPVICTEWMTRHSGARWDTDLPLFRREAVGCFSWGLVNGRMQCQFTWWDKPGSPEPKLWFCDLYRNDHTPYDPKEIELIRQITADKNVDFAARDYSRPQPGPGEVPDTDRSVKYSGGWTLWKGSGPRCGTLHYHNAAGGRVNMGFDGTAVHLVYKVGPDCGLAQVLIDGKPATKQHGGELKADALGNATLDTYGSAVDWNHRALVAGGLAPGKHALTVVVTGQKNPASANCYVQIVGVDVEDSR